MKNKQLYTAIIFGIVSVPWTYIFTLIEVPLLPSFISSASYFASGKKFFKSYLNNFLGIIYAGLTLLFSTYLFTNSPMMLSVIVGIFMFIGSMHYVYKILSFLPAVFFGYATMFSVNAAGLGIFGSDALPGQVAATAVSMLFGAMIGLGVDASARRMSPG